MEPAPEFTSVVDECRYWMERAKHYHSEWKDTKQAYDEYVDGSGQLEAELDSHLKQKDRIIRDLLARVSTLEKDNESVRLKLDSNKIESANLEQQLEATVLEKESLKTYLRQLEQKNDDLERAHRILSESIAGFEGMLDKAYEKNALLESEVDEKEVLQEKLQRLMDETRDLKQELNVKNRFDSPDNNPSIDLNVDNSMQKSEQTQTVNSSTVLDEFLPHSLKNPQNLINGNAMAASSRTTTLHIVADMLRKINLDKTLMCSRCDKFRCICERPLQQENNNSNLSGSSSSVTSTPPSCNSNRKSYDAASNLFGTNIFKRFAQKVSGISTNDETDNAMESKLKAYREQAQAPASATIQPRK